MSFNELNSVEHFIIRLLTGVNLNKQEVQENVVAMTLQEYLKARFDNAGEWDKKRL